ncbi:carbohydrate kinase family protein [Nocardia sp. NPDC059246]|uniref:carbohydrate kinase family protein n=1 Tax=unclassified Nocardia TaxID=2637762 RepID=UPI0036D1540D
MSAGVTVVTGSIATDHLMRFPGRFADNMIDTHLDRLSLSFLVNDLVVHRGGVAANIAFGLGMLGRDPLLVGAVGPDFAEYRRWLEDHGVDCSEILVSDTAQTARFTCTTDDDQCQLASFYPGAMSEASGISLARLTQGRDVGLVHIGANDPAAMLAYSEEARAIGVPFAADPSQNLPMFDREQARSLVEGAKYLFTNEYEWELLLKTTEWSERQIAERVDLRITTLGSAGCVIVDRARPAIEVDVLPARHIVDPTGVGDGFRAGFLTGVDSGLPVERAAQLGSLIATLVLEAAGPQEWSLDIEDAGVRVADAYGMDVVADLQSVLRIGSSVS